MCASLSHTHHRYEVGMLIEGIQLVKYMQHLLETITVSSSFLSAATIIFKILLYSNSGC